MRQSPCRPPDPRIESPSPKPPRRGAHGRPTPRPRIYTGRDRPYSACRRPTFLAGGNPQTRRVSYRVARFRWRACSSAFAPGARPKVLPGRRTSPTWATARRADVTPQVERRIGESIMREIRRDPAYVDDPEMKDYVQAIGYRLVAASGETRQDFEFFVMRDKTVNAFAMPGGFIGVHTGLLLAAQTESEFASVIGHEIAHVLQRHMARQYDAQSKISKVSLLALALALLAARSNRAGRAGRRGRGAGGAGGGVPQPQPRVRARGRPRRLPDAGGRRLRHRRHAEASSSGCRRRPGCTRTTRRRTCAPTRSPPSASPTCRTGSAIGAIPAAARQRGVPTGARQAARRRRHGRRKRWRSFAPRSPRSGSPAKPRCTTATLPPRLRAKDWKHGRAPRSPPRASSPRRSRCSKRSPRGSRHDAGDPPARRRSSPRRAPPSPTRCRSESRTRKSCSGSAANKEAVALLDELAKGRLREPRVYQMIAKSYAALGQRTQQHRALAESYLLQGSLPAAIEQLQFAQSAGDPTSTRCRRSTRGCAS